MSEKIYYGPHGNTFTMKSRFEGFINAFWRRIYSYRNDYERVLPDEMPVEFRASMYTALGLFPIGTIVNNNMAGTQHIIELPENITLDVGNRYRLVLVEEADTTDPEQVSSVE